MAEGVTFAGRPVAAGVLDDPRQMPPATEEAPRGWTWNRDARAWKPKIRGRIQYSPPAEDSHPYPPTHPGGLNAILGQPETRGDHSAPGDAGRDPAPAWAGSGPEEPAQAAQLQFEEIPQQIKDDIAGLAGLVATPILAVARTLDPYCGQALADSFAGVLEATLPLICRSEKIVKYFSEDTADWLLWGKLALALAPVGKAIAEHHILRTVEVRRDDAGNVVILRAAAGGDGQHLVPPVQQEYSPDAYAA